MKHRFTTLLLAVAALAFPSCSLEEDTSAISTPDNFFRNASECQMVVNSCYIPIKSIYTYTYLLATECCTDIAYCSSGTLDASLDISPAIPRFGQTVWTQGYLGVQRCNFALANIEENENLTEDDRYALVCEARTLRAFYYWTLTSFFGDVPFYLYDVTDNAMVDKAASLGRMSASATRKALIADLQEIAPLVPQTRSSDNVGNRFGAAMAWMMIAEMAAWEQDWQTVIDAGHSLEDIYGDFEQYDYEYNALWRNKNTPESIFEVQHIYESAGLSYTSNAACICTPTRKTSNGVTTFDGLDIPELGTQCTTWSAMRPTSFFCQGLQSKKSKDIRKSVNMAWEYDGHTFSNVNTAPWPGPKFWCPNMQATYDGNNYKVFRYATAILLIAEAYCESGDDKTALTYLNKTRVRAGIGEYTFRTHARLLEEIRNEMARECWGDFHRKFDLVRWGTWYDDTIANNTYTNLLKNIQPCHRYYPIPDKEVVYSKYALDNKEYEKYGL